MASSEERLGRLERCVAALEAQVAILDPQKVISFMGETVAAFQSFKADATAFDTRLGEAVSEMRAMSISMTSLKGVLHNVQGAIATEKEQEKITQGKESKAQNRRLKWWVVGITLFVNVSMWVLNTFVFIR